MRKIRSLTGMPVIMNGKRIARLVRAELSDDLKELRGIWTDSGLHGSRFIPSEHLGMIGEMAVTVDCRGIRRSRKSQPAVRRAVSTDGRRLGAITGADIDEVTFTVQALEMSGGLWEDLYLGRRRVCNYSVSTQNADVILHDSAENSKEDEA